MFVQHRSTVKSEANVYSVLVECTCHSPLDHFPCRHPTSHGGPTHGGQVHTRDGLWKPNSVCVICRPHCVHHAVGLACHLLVNVTAAFIVDQVCNVL